MIKKILEKFLNFGGAGVVRIYCVRLYIQVFRNKKNREN